MIKNLLLRFCKKIVEKEVIDFPDQPDKPIYRPTEKVEFEGLKIIPEEEIGVGCDKIWALRFTNYYDGSPHSWMRNSIRSHYSDLAENGFLTLVSNTFFEVVKLKKLDGIWYESSTDSSFMRCSLNKIVWWQKRG